MIHIHRDDKGCFTLEEVHINKIIFIESALSVGGD